MRAQLGIEDVILRGLGMFPNKQKYARVCTRALLANLHQDLDAGLERAGFVKIIRKTETLI